MVVGKISYKVFLDFVCAKAFDVISENRYRKVLSKNRETGEEWAVKVHQSILLVQDSAKQVLQLVSNLSSVCHMSGLERSCREVLKSTSPPTKSKDRVGICSVSGVRCEGCIEVSRPHSCKFTQRSSRGAGSYHFLHKDGKNMSNPLHEGISFLLY